MANPRHYYRPTTLTEALELARQPDSIALAGGAATLGVLDLPFETFVDLQAIPDLKKIRQQEDGWYDIGAACSLQQVAELPGLPDVMRRSLARAIPLNIRNGTSVGESLLQPRRFREWVTVLVAHDIAIHQLLPNGETAALAASDAILQPSDVSLRQGIITGISIPALDAHEALGASFVARTPADEPIVNAAVFVRLDEAGRVETLFPAISGASEAVVSLAGIRLNGQPLTETTITSAGENITDIQPVGDDVGSADYRAEMARVTLRRALLECLERLG